MVLKLGFSSLNMGSNSTCVSSNNIKGLLLFSKHTVHLSAQDRPTVRGSCVVFLLKLVFVSKVDQEVKNNSSYDEKLYCPHFRSVSELVSFMRNTELKTSIQGD